MKGKRGDLFKLKKRVFFFSALIHSFHLQVKVFLPVDMFVAASTLTHNRERAGASLASKGTPQQCYCAVSSDLRNGNSPHKLLKLQR